MLEVINPMLKYPTMGLEQVVQKKAVKITTLSDMLLKYQDDSGMQVLSTAKMETADESKMAEMKRWLISNTALFQHDQLVGFLSPQEGESYNYFIHGFNHADLPIKSPPSCTDGDLTVMLNGEPPEIKVIPTDEGLSLSVKANLEFELAENTCNVKLTEQDIGTLEDCVNKELSQSLEEIILHTQQEHMDIFDVADSLHAGHLQLWNEVKENWQEIYSKMPFEIEVNARYRNSRAMIIDPGYKE